MRGKRMVKELVSLLDAGQRVWQVEGLNHEPIWESKVYVDCGGVLYQTPSRDIT